MMAKQHARSGSLHDVSSIESDTVPEALPPYPLPPTLPKKKGIFKTFRNSFKRTKAKQHPKDTQTEIEILRKERNRLKQENTLLKIGMKGILNNNPFYVNNFQLGDNFYMVTNTDEDLEGTLHELGDLVMKLTDSLEKMIDDMSKIEKESENNKVILAEIQETVVEGSKKFEHKTKDDTKYFTEIKNMLKALKSDRSDTHVISDCVDELQDYISQRRMVVDYDSLPRRVQAGITRLVRKFGYKSWQEFARRLGVNPQSINWNTQPNEPNSESDKASLLDRDKCSRIMAEWVKEPGHTAAVFMELFRNIDRERTNEAKQRLRCSMIQEKKHGKGIVQSKESSLSYHSSTSSDSTPSHRERMARYASQQLGEQQTQTAHAVEDLKKTMLEGFETMTQMKREIHEIHETFKNNASSVPWDASLNVAENKEYALNGRGDDGSKWAHTEEYAPLECGVAGFKFLCSEKNSPKIIGMVIRWLKFKHMYIISVGRIRKIRNTTPINMDRIRPNYSPSL